MFHWTIFPENETNQVPYFFLSQGTVFWGRGFFVCLFGGFFLVFKTHRMMLLYYEFKCLINI